MNFADMSEAPEEEETSLYKRESITKVHGHSKQPDRPPYKQIVLGCLFLIAIALSSAYLIEAKDQQISAKIQVLRTIRIGAQMQKRHSTSSAQMQKKPSISSIVNPLTPEKPSPAEDINYQLFEDQKVTITKRTKPSAAGDAPSQVKGKMQENNPIMKTYLQGVNQAISKGDNVEGIIEEMMKDKEKDKFVIPRQIWVYSENQEEENQFVKKCLENTRRIANRSGFEVVIVNQGNLMQLIDPARASQFGQTIKVLTKESVSNPLSGYDAVIHEVKKELALLEVLHHKGGIIMDSNVILTEDLLWLAKISANQYANCGNPEFPTKYFGFHNVNFTSNEEKYSNTDGSWKFILKYVGLESFFLAGVPQQEFLSQILKVMHILFVNPQSTRSTLSALKIGKAITNFFIISNAFPIACRIVLKEKQKLSEKGLLSLDYFGIKSINSYFFPKKLNHYFEYSFQDKMFRNLASSTLEELEETVGPLRYMVLIPYDAYINDRLHKLFQTTLTPQNSQFNLLHPESFLIKHLFVDAEKSYLETEIESNEMGQTGERWEALPKIIWTQQPVSKKRNFVDEVLFRNIKRQAQAAGFEVREVNPSNLQQWLDKYEVDWIKNTADKAKVKMFAKMKLDIAKLHILIRYGGVWLSKHCFALESFQWLSEIRNYPTQHVFNRYGNFPQVVMYFYPHYGQPFEWTFDSAANTKNMWHVALDSNFIAAQPDAQLLKDWVRTLTKFLTRPYNDNLNEMIRLSVDTERWTVKDNAYFAALDAVKMVMANKQREINNLATDNQSYIGPKSSPEFYRVWSINGAQGPLKLDSSFASLSVEKGELNPKSNSLIWRYPRSYAEGILGRLHKMSKLYHISSAQLLRVISGQSDPQGFTSGQIHPSSIFYKQLLQPVKSSLKLQENKLVLE